MSEPRVIVLFVSPLEGVFVVNGGIPEHARKSYQTLTGKRMKTLFVTDSPLDVAAKSIESLDPPAPVLNFNAGLHVPDESDFPISALDMQSKKFDLTELINKLRANGDIVIPVGIGRLPEHAFLNDVELAALLPESERPGGEVSVYQCKADGPAGWSEWADTMMRRIRIILRKSEMRQWNGV